MLSILHLNRFKDNFFHGQIDNNFISFISGLIVFLIILFSCVILSLNSIFGNWEDDLNRVYTIQVLPYYKDVNGINKISEEDVVKRTDLVKEKLNKLKGVNEIKIQEDAKSIENIKKLIGAGVAGIDGMPIPKIIKVSTSEFFQVSFDDVDRAVKNIDGIKVFNNKSWIQEFVSFSNVIKRISLFIISVLFLTSIIVVFYFTKSFLKTQKKVIKVAFVVGAHDEFIANAFANRIFVLAGMGAFLGAFLAFFILITLGVMFNDIFSMVKINVGISFVGWVVISTIPFVITFLFHLVARKTVLKYLVNQERIK